MALVSIEKMIEPDIFIPSLSLRYNQSSLSTLTVWSDSAVGDLPNLDWSQWHNCTESPYVLLATNTNAIPVVATVGDLRNLLNGIVRSLIVTGQD